MIFWLYWYSSPLTDALFVCWFFGIFKIVSFNTLLSLLTYKHVGKLMLGIRECFIVTQKYSEFVNLLNKYLDRICRVLHSNKVY